MRITLTVTEGPHQGQVFVFDGHDTFLVGRSKRAHFRLPSKDRYFSRIHFLVEVNPPHCRLMDMSSSNGTYVNGKRVERTDLHDGDTIRAGQTVLQVAVTADARRPPPPPSERPPQPGPADRRPRRRPGRRPSRRPAAPGRRPAGPPSAGRPGRALAAPPPRRRQPRPARPGPACALRGAVDGDRELALCPACRAEPLAATDREGYHLIRELGRGAMGLVYLAVRRIRQPAGGPQDRHPGRRRLRGPDHPLPARGRHPARAGASPHRGLPRHGRIRRYALFRHGLRPRSGRPQAAQEAGAVRRRRAAASSASCSTPWPSPTAAASSTAT